MFSFIKNRSIFYGIAILLIVLSLISPWILGINQGIDLTGGIQIEYALNGANKEDVINTAKSGLVESVDSGLPGEYASIITDKNIYGITNQDTVVIEAGIDESAAKKADGTIDLQKVQNAKDAFRKKLLTTLNTSYPSLSQSEYYDKGASVSEYIRSSGYRSLIGVILAISLYILYAFRGSIPGMVNWPFSAVTALTLFHDVVIAFGLYMCASFFFPEFKIDTFFITAMLTVLGYSINDTIVVMDRIRSNLHHHSNKKQSGLKGIIDASIHDTIRRSLFTSLTVLMVLVTMFIFGPDSIRGFTLALMFGTLVGTYSSICIAAPLLYDLISLGKLHKK